MSGQLKERFKERLFLYGLSLIRDAKREREAKTYAFFVLVQVRNTTSRGL